MRPRPVEILPTQADGLVAALRNGLVAPLNGSSVLAAGSLGGLRRSRPDPRCPAPMKSRLRTHVVRCSAGILTWRSNAPRR